MGSLVVIRAHQGSLVLISGHQWSLRAHQRSSAAPERAGRHHRKASCSHALPAPCLGKDPPPWANSAIAAAVLSASPAASPMSAVHAACGGGAP